MAVRRAGRRAYLRVGLAGALCALLAVSAGDSGTRAATSPQAVQRWEAAAERRRAEEAARRPARPGPPQAWGSAAGQAHAVDGPRNRTVPQSLRGRYPLRRPQPVPAAPANKAQVAAAPATEGAGFDSSTSREVPALRSATERTYRNADGTETTEVAGERLHYRDAAGAWRPVDNTLRPDPAGGWRNAADETSLRLADRADAAQLAVVSYDSGHSIGYALSGAGAVPGKARGDTVTYPGVRSGVDLELQAQSGGVKETLILHRPSTMPFLFPMRLTGLTASVAGEAIELRDETRTLRATIPAGVMVDAAGATAAVPYTLTGSTLVVRPDPEWLADPARRYPVRVDPSVEQAGADSAMVVQGSSSRGGTSELLAGNVGGDSASYLKFTGLADRLRFHTIYGAQLQLVNYDAPSCTARPVTVHPVTSAWTATGSYAYPGPSVGAALDSESFAYGYIALGSAASRCPARASLFDLGRSGRDLVQGWVNGGANNGLSIRASTTDSRAWKRFAGTGTANAPRLYVTHSPYNAAYAIPNPVPVPPVLQNQAGKVKVTITHKGAETWNPGTYYLAYRAYNAVTGASVTQQRSAELPAALARGGRVTLDATIKAMPPGRYFLDFTMVKSGGVVFTDQQVPPARIVLQVFDVAPVVQELSPPNGYQAQTLSPQLWARAVDIDAPPGSALQFKFEYCERSTAGTRINCANSGYLRSQAWAPPAGALSWSKTYEWRAAVKDGTNEVFSAWSTLLTSVPQPEITSHVAGAPYAGQDREFDPLVGNYSTGAVDAGVATVGPDLRVVRTYNSLDPRRDLAFGAGWVTQFDSRLVPDDDGSGNVVVTYSDGQQVRFGRNADGTYAAPAGRVASLTLSAGQYVLADRSGATYTYSGTGRLTRITDAGKRSVALIYDQINGKLARAQVDNSQTNHAGRSLRFGWTGAHITSVSTDAVNGAPLVWTYAYTGDLLTTVCAPGSLCTTYTYAAGSHYRSAVLDSTPESYYRLGESEGAAAGSEIAVNLGKDAGPLKTVTLGAPGALAGTGDTAATFNGTTSYVDLPNGTLKKNRDAAIELWFKIGPTQSGGPLLGYQDKALDKSPTAGAPLLYVGTDGRLRGQFRTASVTPMASAGTVNDNRWHHVVLSATGATQTLWLDGTSVATLAGAIDHSTFTGNQIGAAYATPAASWPGWGTTARRSFSGTIDEVALYAHPLGSAAVKAHLGLAAPADQVASVTLPSGRVASQVTYDVRLDRVLEYTDRNGGTWKVGSPAVTGGDTDLRRTVQVLDPADRPWLYEFDALAGRVLRTGVPTGLGVREEDRPGYRTPTPTPSPSPTELCSQPDPSDPRFCTIVPGSAGGPVFVGHSLDGVAIRSFSYNDAGQQDVITNEAGEQSWLTYDARGNVTVRKTCRTTTLCHSEYYTFPATVTNPLDPRNDLPSDYRDGRSTSATDTTYRTSYSYLPSGELATQTNPDSGVVRTTYSTGAESAVGGGAVPPALPVLTTDPRGAQTRYEYFQNGDLARVTDPAGLITSFTYDALGRRITETEVSDSYPAGLLTTYTYDALSRPSVTTEPATTNAVTGVAHQRVTTLTYDPDGLVTRQEVKDGKGADAARVTLSEYDEQGRLRTLTDPEGNETTYGYDRFGNRTSELDANGNQYEYAFTSRNKIAEVRLRDWHGDPAGAPEVGDYLVLTSYAYDLAGRVASRTDSMGRRLEYQYYRDDKLNKTILRDFRNPDGSKRDFVVQALSYDGAGNLIREEAGNGTQVTTQTFTRTGQVASSVEDPSGLARETRYAYDLAGNVTRTSWFGKASNVPWPTATSGEVVEYGYDLAGNRTEERVLAAGQPTLVTSYGYDKRGLTVSRTDPRGAGFTTTFGYDELGRQTTTRQPSVQVEQGGAAAVAANPTTTAGLDTFDQQVAGRDARGNTTTSAYDRLGRPTSVTSPSYTTPGGVALIATTTSTYDALGNLTQVQDPRGFTSRYTYDRLNRVIARSEPTTDDNQRAEWRYEYTRTGDVLSVIDPVGARADTTYDDLDRQISVSQRETKPVPATHTTGYTYDDAGNVTAITAPSGARTTMAYDALGELTRTTTAANVAVQAGYDLHGRQIRTTDGIGRTSTVEYDGYGRVSAEADLRPTGDTLRRQSYAYDQAGNLTASTNALNDTTTYAYDAANRLTRQVEPTTGTESITTSFGYDASGARTRYTDGRGNSTMYTYTTWGTPATVVEPSTPAYPAAADRTWTVGYDKSANPVTLAAPGGVSRTRTFDAGGRMTREAGTGAPLATADRTFAYDKADRLISAGAPGGDNTYAYDDRGELISATGPGGTASFTYNPDGQVTRRTDGAGTADFAYTAGRLTSVTDGVTRSEQKLSYDAAGLLKTIDYGAGRIRTYGYDDAGRITTDTVKNTAAAVVSSITYGYDNDDRLTGKTTTGTAGAAANTYGYDKAGRLTSWTAGATTTAYGWDDAGNRIRAGAKAATYDARNRLLDDGDYSYTYTARGTLASRTSSGLNETSTFDAFDRLVRQGGQSFEYDSLDRVAKRNTVAFRYAGLSDEPVGDGVEIYARGPDDELLAVQDGTRKRLTLADEHGDVVGDFDPADTTLSALPDSTSYDPFGKRTGQTGADLNVGYQGDWTDPATSQVNMGARWYTPATGTFSSRDTAEYGGGPSILANRYTYGAGDPLDYTDPDGNFPCFKVCDVAKKVGGAIVSGAKKAGSVIANGAKSLYNLGKSAVSSFWSGLQTGFRWALSGVKWTINAIGSGAKWVYDKAKSGISRASDAIRSGYKWVAGKVSSGTSWARQKAEAAKRAAVAAAHRVTNAAKAAATYAVRHNPLPAIAAAVKPLYSGITKVVSAAASLPAAVVSTVRDVVHDAAKSVQAVYQAAINAAGTVVENVSKAAQAASQFVQDHAATIAGIVAGAVVGIGCGLAIGWTGVGAVACGALAGAVGSMVTDLVEGGHSWQEIAANAVTSGVFGGITGGLGSVAGSVIGSGARALGTALRGSGRSAVAAGRSQTAAAGRGLTCNSFAAGTAVVLADGTTKKIEDVREGDLVLATDPTTGRTEARPVTELIHGQGEKRMVEVTVDADGARGDETGTLTATDGHPFWVPSLDEWVEAGSLQAGMLLRTAAGTYVQVGVVKRWTAPDQRAYNLTVDGLHTYYVSAGTTKVLVHNCRGTVWDDIKATQPEIAGTGGLPKSFELAAGDSRVWVHGNAIEHIAEYAKYTTGRGASPEVVGLVTQQNLRSLQAAVGEAGQGGLPFGRLVNVGGWELRFGTPRQQGMLPALVHARMVG